MNKKVSIIIVHYKAQDVLYACLQSIKKSKTKISYEVILIDNDDKTVIHKEIKEKYPWIIYIKSPKNLGFGTGNNLGSKYAKGEYLFFLNPDTIVFPDTIDLLVHFLNQNKKAAIAAPLLLDKQKSPYPLQGTSRLTPLQGIVALSFLNKIFPDNIISRKYWLKDWDKTKTREVDVVPGTAFMIRKKVFDLIGGFDKKFFLYFEESDLCKRITEKGYKIFLLPNTRLIHLWGKGGTQMTKNINHIFAQSRFYYFRKHYGILNAIIVELFTKFSKKSIISHFPFFLASSFFLFFQLQIFNINLDFRDEGFLTYNALRIIQGEIPYRDFFLTTTPGTYYVQAFLMQIFGNYLILARILYILITLGVMFIVSRLFRFNSYLDYLLLFFLGTIFISPIYAFYNLEGLLLFILSFYLLKRVLKYQKFYLYVILGVVSSVLFLIKQSYGGVNMALLLLSFFVFNKKGNLKKSIILYLSSAGLIFIVYAGYLFFHQALDQFIYYVFSFSKLVKNHRYPFILTALVFIPLYISTIIFIKKLKLKQKIIIFSVFLFSFSCLYFIISPSRIERFFVVFRDPLVYYYLALLIVPLTTIGLCIKEKITQRKELLLLSLFSLGLFLASASSGRDYTTVQMVSPFFLPLCILLLQNIKTNLIAKLLCIIVVSIYSLPFIISKTNIFLSTRQYNSYIPNARAASGIKISQAEARELSHSISYIKSNISKSEKIICFPYCPLLFVLSERNSGSYFSFYYPETFLASNQDQVINDITLNKPTMIILQRKGTIEREANYEDKRLAKLKSFFLKRYQLQNQTENFSFYIINK